MLQAFETRKSSLVINLMESDGFPVLFDRDIYRRGLTEQQLEDWICIDPHNVKGNTHSFMCREEATQATRRLSNFFKEVLLPLAAETNALILCAAKNTDILSTILSENLPLFAAKHGGRLPFSVFAVGPAANNFTHAALHARRYLRM